MAKPFAELKVQERLKSEPAKTDNKQAYFEMPRPTGTVIDVDTTDMGAFYTLKYRTVSTLGTGAFATVKLAEESHSG